MGGQTSTHRAAAVPYAVIIYVRTYSPTAKSKPSQIIMIGLMSNIH